jgi:HKD family nuclease
METPLFFDLIMRIVIRPRSQTEQLRVRTTPRLARELLMFINVQERIGRKKPTLRQLMLKQVTFSVTQYPSVATPLLLALMQRIVIRPRSQTEQLRVRTTPLLPRELLMFINVQERIGRKKPTLRQLMLTHLTSSETQSPSVVTPLLLALIKRIVFRPRSPTEQLRVRTTPFLTRELLMFTNAQERIGRKKPTLRQPMLKQVTISDGQSPSVVTPLLLELFKRIVIRPRLQTEQLRVQVIPSLTRELLMFINVQERIGRKKPTLRRLMLEQVTISEHQSPSVATPLLLELMERIVTRPRSPTEQLRLQIIALLNRELLMFTATRPVCLMSPS